MRHRSIAIASRPPMRLAASHRRRRCDAMTMLAALVLQAGGGLFVLSKILSEVKLRTEINFGFPYCGESRGVRLRFKKVVSLYSCLGEVVVLVLMQLWPGLVSCFRSGS